MSTGPILHKRKVLSFFFLSFFVYWSPVLCCTMFTCINIPFSLLKGTVLLLVTKKTDFNDIISCIHVHISTFPFISLKHECNIWRVHNYFRSKIPRCPTSMSATWVNKTVDRKLCQILRLNFTSLSYLYWQAATEATLLNTHAPILVRASWQEHVWKWPKAVSAPYPPWRVRRFDNLKAWTHRIPFEMLLFEAAKRWGSVGRPQGKWRRNRKGMLVFSNTSC